MILNNGLKLIHHAIWQRQKYLRNYEKGILLYGRVRLQIGGANPMYAANCGGMEKEDGQKDKLKPRYTPPKNWGIKIPYLIPIFPSFI